MLFRIKCIIWENYEAKKSPITVYGAQTCRSLYNVKPTESK